MDIEVRDDNGDFVSGDLTAIVCPICAELYNQCGYCNNYGQIVIDLMLAGC